MLEKVYTFYSLDGERDSAEAKKCYALAVQKTPALEETARFIFDGFRGLNPEISEKTLDDAFECAINRDKYFIYSGNYPSDQKKRMADDAELSRNLMKEALKSWLTIKNQ